MAEKQKMKISDKLKIGFLLAYFLILTVERVISLVSVFWVIFRLMTRWIGI